MDQENYDQVILSSDVLGDALKYLRENTEATVLFFDGNPVSIDLPPSVELIVKDRELWPWCPCFTLDGVETHGFLPLRR
jgi:elongation factor P